MQSKSKLVEAADRAPQRTALYTLKKYCKIPVGESKEDRKYVSLRPNQKISVSWLYEDMDNPTPLEINFDGPQDVNPEEGYQAMWNGNRLLNWLLRNSREET